MKIIKMILVIIILTVFSPVLFWYQEFTYIKLKNFLSFGRAVIGGYDGKIKIGTNKNNVIYEINDYSCMKKYDLPKPLLNMNVYSYWIEDDYLFIKVFKNDKKLKKLLGE